MKKKAFAKAYLSCIMPAIALIIIQAASWAAIVDFEDLPEVGSPLAIGDPGQEWHGDDEFENNPPEYTHTASESDFTNKGVTFNNIQDQYMTQWDGWEYEVDYWDGWAYSNRCDIETSGFAGQFTAMGSGDVGQNGALISAQYGIVSVAASAVESYSTIHFDIDRSVESAYLTNNAYAYSSMLNGDSFAKKFGGETGDEADWFLLTITGKDAVGQTTGTAGFYLADLRFANNEEDYIVDSWTPVDLSGLGDNVRSIEFAMSSSDSGTFGMNTPAYFAIDNIEFAPIPGDANDDGYVDVSDLGILATNYGASGDAQWSDGDFNGDYAVDVVDLGILATAYNNDSGSAPSPAVPEPSTLCMLTALCGLMLWPRKRR